MVHPENQFGHLPRHCWVAAPRFQPGFPDSEPTTECSRGRRIRPTFGAALLLEGCQKREAGPGLDCAFILVQPGTEANRKTEAERLKRKLGAMSVTGFSHCL